MPAPRPLLSAVIMLAFAPFIVCGQRTAAPARTACLFPVVDLSAGGQGPDSTPAPLDDVDRSQSLFSAVSTELGAAGFQLVPESQWRSGEGANLSAQDSLDPSRVAGIARAAGAELAVTGFYDLHDDRILISVSCYDARTGSLMAGFMKTWRYNLGIYSTLHGELQDLLSHLNLGQVDQSQGGQKQAAGPVLLPAVTFTSPQEGMEVILAGDRSAGRIEGGKLVFAAPGTKPGQTLLVEKRLDGYHTAWQRVRAAPVIALTPLARRDRVAVESSWTFGQLIGAGAAIRFYAVPDSTFFTLSLYPYGQAPASQGGNWLVHIDTELSMGSYLFFPPNSLIRLGISTGLGFIVSVMPAAQMNLPDYFDGYLNILSPWVELNLPHVSFFLRPEVKLALGASGPNLLGRTVILAGNTFPPVTLGALFKW